MKTLEDYQNKIMEGLLNEDEKKSYRETLLYKVTEALELNGKTPDDVKWVGNSKMKFSWEHFCSVANQPVTNFDNVADDLKICGDDWWLELEDHDYHGYRWVYSTCPVEPKLTVNVNKVIDYDSCWVSLDEMNQDQFDSEVLESAGCETESNINGYMLVTPLDEGLTKSEIISLARKLPDDGEFIPLSIYGKANSAGHGFVDIETYEEDESNRKEFEVVVSNLLDDWDNEREDKTYGDGKVKVFIDFT